MKKLMILLVGIMLLPVTALANVQLSAQPQLRVMFIQTATSASVHALSKKKDTYTLTMTGVRPYITYFSDRPQRVTGLLPMGVFVQEWAKGKTLAKDAPNADLVGMVKLNGKHGMKQVAVSLSNPVYRPESGEISYTIVPLNGKQKMISDKANIRHATLFIDDMCASCSGGGF